MSFSSGQGLPGSVSSEPTDIDTLDKLKADINHVIYQATSHVRACADDPIPLASARLGGPGNSLNGLGEYVQNMSQMLKKLTTELTNDFMTSRISELDVPTSLHATDSSDQTMFLELEEYMEEQLKLSVACERFHEQVQAIRNRRSVHTQKIDRPILEVASSIPVWTTAYTERPAALIPKSIESDAEGGSSTRSSSKRKSLPGEAHLFPAEEWPRDPVSDLEAFSNVDLAKYQKRGKGKNHFCPRGWECTKGGVKDGELVSFDRNSAFKQHLNKHKKPFVCDHPGCPNAPDRRHFARPDGLARHQRFVKHGPVISTTDALTPGLEGKVVQVPENDYALDGKSSSPSTQVGGSAKFESFITSSPEVKREDG